MKYPFNLIHLKFFCDAVALQSVSEAAKKNFVTQSAISQGIAKLERILGVQLATHSRSNFNPTQEGRVVFDQAGDIFKALDGMEEKLNENKQVIRGNLSFICTHSLGLSYIASAFKKMRELHPEVNLKFRLGGLPLIRSALHQRTEEFALVVCEDDFSQFNKEIIHKGQFQLYQKKGTHNCLFNQGVMIDDKNSLYVHELRFDFKKTYLTELPIQAELAGWEVVARFAEKDIGVGFFPDYLINDNRYPHLELHPHSLPNYPYEIGVIYKKGEKLSRAALAFTKLLKELMQ